MIFNTPLSHPLLLSLFIYTSSLSHLFIQSPKSTPESRHTSLTSHPTMKISTGVVALVACVVLLPLLVPARTIGRIHSHHGHHHKWKHGRGAEPNSYEEGRQARGSRPADTVQVAGSSLPDCSHACGSCFPCRLVMVSFVCASIQEAETCPMAYKCMCRSKSYPVP